MLFPYNTNAPIYHFPYGTLGLIVINALVFFSTTFSAVTEQEFESLIWLCLQFDRINPIQWLTNNFMHADIVHLVSNMIFLWTFGLVVEGKLGWKRYLLAYVTIAITSSCFTQFFMFVFTNSPSFALGASGVIFGLMGIALLWAPMNDMKCFVYLGVFSRVIEIPIYGVCGFYFAIQVLCWTMSGFQMSSEALHLIGLAFGLPIGLALLARGDVDCEGWDIFNVWRGNEIEASRESLLRRRGHHQILQQAAAEQTAMVENAHRLLQRAIEEQRHAVVVALYKKHEHLLDEGKLLNATELAAVVSAMHRCENWTESLPLLRLGIEKHASLTTPFRLRYAQVLLQHAEQPRRALKELEQLPAELPPNLDQRRDQLRRHAQRQIDSGTIEFQSE